MKFSEFFYHDLMYKNQQEKLEDINNTNGDLKNIHELFSVPFYLANVISFSQKINNQSSN